MIENCQDMSFYALSEIVSCETILKLALENLTKKKGEYYELMKDYVLNYKKTDNSMKLKLKEIIIFLQEFEKNNGMQKTVKNLHFALEKLGAKNRKSIYLRLFSICIKYSADDFKQVFLSSN
ncbi:MAG: hypothetical protein IJ877_04220 [Candidatus Gastranaerophilales bacterium]|nr:hypothetical protein [Candidatus Gastranaerophilales bacterium]